MQITSIEFLIFFLITLGIYHILSPRFRCGLLLAASYFFYGSQKLSYLYFLVLATLFSYGLGLLLEKAREKTKKARALLGFALTVNCLLLGMFKYLGFLSGGRLESPLMPVGISFYLFMSMGYLVDVYRGNIEAEKNLLRYGLFVSFFPTILSGPIERAGNMLSQFTTESLSKISFDTKRIRDGFVRMLWGYFMKLVLADRIAVMVNTVYASPAGYGGTIIVLATILYTFQIYCDFAGYSHIAIGLAQTLGFKVMDNFRSPYLAVSIGDFWRRWHISLSSWFKDYVYIPLGGNRKGKGRKYLNILLVFLLSGLWHGAGWTFILWGGFHGSCQILGGLLAPFGRKMAEWLNLREGSFSLKALRVCWTFFLVNGAWVLFRADSFSMLLELFKRFSDIQLWQLFDGTLYRLGVDRAGVHLVLAGLALVLLVDLLNEKGCFISRRIAKERLWIRWPIYWGAVLLILLCGMWGSGYSAANFIYYQF